jgi:2-methylisocitrate lyase-like PEP mutase family enzyme
MQETLSKTDGTAGGPSRARRLRDAMEQGLVLAPGVYNALFAKLAEQTGFEAIYMTGFGTAARYGYPDVGLVTQTEMQENVRYICGATSIPLIADSDTGYGGIINVRRTVRGWEQAGAAALHIEDQVFPKKCGFMEGKQVIPIEEAVQKVRAALDARLDPDFIIIARTDALAPNGWDDAITRAKAYREVGADLVFVDGIRTAEDIRMYSSELAKRGIPCLYNGALVSGDEAAALGFRVQILAGLALGAVYSSANEAMHELATQGSALAVADRYRMPDDEGMNELLGLSHYYELERRYGVAAAR